VVAAVFGDEIAERAKQRAQAAKQRAQEEKRRQKWQQQQDRLIQQQLLNRFRFTWSTKSFRLLFS
jgi:hypothetical protein